MIDEYGFQFLMNISCTADDRSGHDAAAPETTNNHGTTQRRQGGFVPKLLREGEQKILQTSSLLSLLLAGARFRSGTRAIMLTPKRETPGTFTGFACNNHDDLVELSLFCSTTPN